MKNIYIVKAILLIAAFISAGSVLAEGKPNSDEQFRALYPKASAGDAAAMYALGKIYLEGTSSAGRDQSKAMDLIHRAAAAGDVSATKYLVDSYEGGGAAGDAKALDLCQKLKKAGDKYCDSKMEKLIERSIPNVLTAASCKKVSEYYAGGHQSAFMKKELTQCVLAGLSTSLTREEAMSNLRVQAEEDPKAFLRLMVFVLKPGTTEWDPLFVEDHLTKVGLSYKDKEVKELFLKNDITFNGCRKMDRLRRETIHQRPAVCRMAARSGDEEAAMYVGEAYLNGKDYFPEEPGEAASYIKDLVNSKNPAIASDAFALSLDLFKKQNKFYEHFALVKQEIKHPSSKIKVAVNAFEFDVEYFQKNHFAMNLDDIQEFVALADKPDIPQALKSKVGRSIDEVIKDRGRLIRAQEKDALMMYRGFLLTRKDLDDIEAEHVAALSAANPKSDALTKLEGTAKTDGTNKGDSPAKPDTPVKSELKLKADSTKPVEAAAEKPARTPTLIERLLN